MAPSALAPAFFAGDEARRARGVVLDRMGFGPRPQPSRTVWRWRRRHLLAYQPPNRRQGAVLIVPAPIKAPYIWDLAPGASVVERLLSAGLQVYKVVWQRPEAEDESMGLAQYADTALGECLDTMRAETGQTNAFLAGHSLGGTLAAIFASLHPDRVAGLVELEAPIEFGSGRMEAAVASSPHLSVIGASFGNVPGTFLNLASAYADPISFGAQPWLDWLASSASAKTNRLHWQVRRWTLDEAPMARRLFEEVGEMLYRENRFAERRLRLAGRLADPRAIDVPILAVLDPRSRIVPPSSIEAYRSRTGSADVQILEYFGDAGVVLQHVGVLVGRNAHETIWPRIAEWLRNAQRSTVNRAR
ncbi:MAG TPA: alpha/beta fold hydrolase [Burkholderiales bacterium]|nr:alpha/beta fold hydrolase [Burkholderiales bacterium]